MGKTTSRQPLGPKARPPVGAASGSGSAVARPVRDRESERFVRKMVWLCVICGLFVAGQTVRYGLYQAQLSEIREQTDALYVSVLGPDIGQSPFGRLQFEHGKLAAGRRIGLDPLSVLAALSRPAVESLRLEGLSITGRTGRVRGFFGPAVDGFDGYVKALAADGQFHFALERREDVFGGIEFSLTVEPL
ncbi:hypothetical protein [Pseudodesulfovibrio alkaliphilus]|nr:hypothetical protein [Pseudodesulfovibrio alkaliphilus]